MNVEKSKLGLDGKEQIDVLDVKCEPDLIPSLLESPGFFKAYHMNKKNWISISIHDVASSKIEQSIKMSFDMSTKEH